MLQPLSPAARMSLGAYLRGCSPRFVYETDEHRPSAQREGTRNDILLVFLFYAIVCLTDKLFGSLYPLCPHTIEQSR